MHYVSFGATPPQGNRVTVCHAYTCKEQTAFTFSAKDMAEIAALMKRTKRSRHRLPRSAAPWPMPSPIWR